MTLLLLLLLLLPDAAGVEAAAPLFAALPFKSASAFEAAVRSSLYSSSSSSSSGAAKGLSGGWESLCGDVAAETATLFMHTQAAATTLCDMPKQVVQYALDVNRKQPIAVQMAPLVALQLSCLKVAHAIGSRVASTELTVKTAAHNRNCFSMCEVLPVMDPAAADRASAGSSSSSSSVSQPQSAAAVKAPASSSSSSSAPNLPIRSSSSSSTSNATTHAALQSPWLPFLFAAAKGLVVLSDLLNEVVQFGAAAAAAGSSADLQRADVYATMRAAAAAAGAPVLAAQEAAIGGHLAGHT
jgi:hypothetical protein